MNAATDTALRDAEDELQVLRGRLALVVAFIHDPAHDLNARTALAQTLHLPLPRSRTRPKEPAS